MLKKIACFWKIRLLERSQKKNLIPGQKSEVTTSFHCSYIMVALQGTISLEFLFVSSRQTIILRVCWCYLSGIFFYWIFFEVFNEKRSDRIAGRRRSVFCFCNFDFECCISIKEMVSQRWRVGQKKMICCESEITSQIQ